MTKEQIYSTSTEPLLDTPFPSFVLLPNGTLVHGNLHHLDYPTKETKELIGNSIHDTLFSEVGDDVIESILTSSAALCLHNIPLSLKGQSPTTCTLYTKPTVFAKEQAISVLCIPNDEVRLMDEEQQHLVDLKNGIHQSFMTVTLDQDGFITQTNQSFLTTSRWTPKRVIGKTLWQLFPQNLNRKSLCWRFGKRCKTDKYGKVKLRN